ncbi:MAG: helix-hairpin-helix domain-containing protein, partial [Erysipelotrichaceae bacterium]
YTAVSEAGASVYSASVNAKKEFPDLEVEERSAISIARRVIDPLAELIKIDPKSIGVGQYQHDLPKDQLNSRLEFVINKSVNLVGVNVNSASKELLSNVAGLNGKIAENIIAYRDEKVIQSRKEIKKIKGVGEKTYQQAIGFLRVIDGKEIFDKTSIHPESYDIANKIFELIKLDKSLIGTSELIEKINTLDIDQLTSSLNSDIYTISDILDALKEPLRDYRDQYDQIVLRDKVLTIEDLQVNDHFLGVVRNVVDFGAFIDIGLKNDALLHISKMSKQKIKHPSDLFSVGDMIDVYVDKIDLDRHKVNLKIEL